MATSGVQFGTSGARGLVSQMTDRVCYAYTLGFLEALIEGGMHPSTLAIGGDRRPSTPRIVAAIARAAEDRGLTVDYLGSVPSPAVALYGIERGCPTVMVTGSHIPADRNGMKYTTLHGEITKADEARIKRQKVTLPPLFDDNGMFLTLAPLPEPDPTGERRYIARYRTAFPSNFLSNLRIGVYAHSAVGRDLLCELYESLGAEVTRLGASEEFVPVDTEAIREEDVELARAWCATGKFDAIVSTDGDSDRPLIADENGCYFRGDVAGILTALFFEADGVACPVSCNTALELSGRFARIQRTKIGSPFVIEGMEQLVEESLERVVGYEANGGFLHESELKVPGGANLKPLPTRDPVIVHLALLGLARAERRPLSTLAQLLPSRVTASDRDPSFETAVSKRLLDLWAALPTAELEVTLGLGSIQVRNQLDGLRIHFQNGEILHLRPSGNAPELRSYAEADTRARAEELVQLGLELARSHAS